MGALGYRNKPRHSGGRIHYQGLAWVDADMGLSSNPTGNRRPSIARARDNRRVEPHSRGALRATSAVRSISIAEKGQRLTPSRAFRKWEVAGMDRTI